MSTRRIPAAAREQLIDTVMEAYVGWREASATAASAYQAWRGAAPAEQAPAFERYHAALDREEEAAAEYERLIERTQFA
jgi:hypothetical protein